EAALGDGGADDGLEDDAGQLAERDAGAGDAASCLADVLELDLGDGHVDFGEAANGAGAADEVGVDVDVGDRQFLDDGLFLGAFAGGGLGRGVFGRDLVEVLEDDVVV